MNASLRLTIRSLSRVKATTLLVVGLIALSVAIGTHVDIGKRSHEKVPLDQYREIAGESQHLMRYSSEDQTEQVIHELNARGADVVSYRVMDAPSFLQTSGTPLQVVDGDLVGLLNRKIVVGVEGRAPSFPGEVALGRRAAAQMGVSLGQTTTSVSGGEVTIVGLVQMRPNVDDTAIFVPHGSTSDGDAFGIFNVAIDGIDRDAVSEVANSFDVSFLLSESDDPEVLFSELTGQYDSDKNNVAGLLGSLTSAVFLFQVVPISAVAFIVGLRRRSADIVRLDTIGVEPAQIKRMLLLEASLIGFVGSVIGLVIGVLSTLVRWNIVVPRIAGDPKLRIIDIEWATFDLVWPMIFSMVAAVGAMWIPARIAVVESGQRLGAPQSSRWWLRKLHVLSGLVMLFGFGALYVMSRLASEFQTSVAAERLLSRSLVVLTGVPILLGLAGLVYSGMRSIADRPLNLPWFLRLSVRDTLRHPARTVSAATAFMVLLIAAVAGSSIQQGIYGSGQAGPPVPENSDVKMVNRYVEATQSRVDLARPSEVTTKTPTFTPGSTQLRATGVWDPKLGDPNISYGLTTLVATSELLSQVDIGEAALAALEAEEGAVLLNGERSSAEATSYEAWLVPELTRAIPYAVAPSSAFGKSTVLVVSPELVAAQQWDTTNLEIVYRERGFSDAELQSFRLLDYGGPGVWLVDGDRAPLGLNSRLFTFVAVAAMVLVIGRVLAGLAAHESSEQQATMTSIGAPPRYKQTQLAWQTVVHVGVAVLVSIPTGLAVSIVLMQGSDYYTTRSPGIPIELLFGLLLLPALSGLFVYLTVGRSDPMVSRRLV